MFLSHGLGLLVLAGLSCPKGRSGWMGRGWHEGAASCWVVVSSSWMWGHRHLDRLSGNGRAELDNVSPWAIVVVVVLWCVCVVAGGVVGDGGPRDLLLARDPLPGEFVPSWCGVGGSVVGVVGTKHIDTLWTTLDIFTLGCTHLCCQWFRR
ncbi:hypothetical protein XENOCAPTIV_005035 [Xenoophorus captivus]|uniref:Secreted protein n=1 Tax=Xenoophorus captivus TaxID=1517983 RepID=A0ABV0QLC7_9TELE